MLSVIGLVSIDHTRETKHSYQPQIQQIITDQIAYLQVIQLRIEYSPHRIQRHKISPGSYPGSLLMSVCSLTDRYQIRKTDTALKV
jgi:hypothetical protein